MISRRTFMLGSGLVAVAPLGSLMHASEYASERATSVNMLDQPTLDVIQQKYHYASTAILKLACWDDFLDSDSSNPGACQLVRVSTSWKIV